MRTRRSRTPPTGPRPGPGPGPVQDLQPGGAEGAEPAGFGVDPLPADFERGTAPAAGVDVDVEPVLDHLGVGHPLEPDLRTAALWVGDAVLADVQVLLGEP